MRFFAILNDETVRPESHDKPFFADSYNLGYAALFDRASEMGVPILLAHDGDYQHGKVRAAWFYGYGQWHKGGEQEICGIYDKFNSSSPWGRQLLADAASRGFPIFNDPTLCMVVDDKLLSYVNFPEYVPYTAYFGKGNSDIQQVIHDFQERCESQGYGEIQSFICKPQTGSAGRNIFRFSQENIMEIFQIPDGEYVLQPFIESQSGIPHLGVRGRHDLRVILANGDFVTSFIRQPRGDGFISNNFDSKEMIYFSKASEVPPDFLRVAQIMDSKFAHLRPRLVSYDLVRHVSGRILCFEMNARPGVMFDPANPEDVEGAKRLHRGILKCIQTVIEESSH
jgi:glutathione synthase/RimK-type ligase-like ATP-grasp enzyme